MENNNLQNKTAVQPTQGANKAVEQKPVTPQTPSVPKAEKPPVEKKTPDGKNKKWLYVGLIVLLVVLFAGISVWYFLIRPQMALRDAVSPDEKVNTDSIIPQTKIEKKGFNVTLVVAPSKNDIVFGDVTISAENVPNETKHVRFSFSNVFDNLNSPDAILGFDSNNQGGWTTTLDTTEYEDGEYYVGVIVFGEDTDGDPIGTTNVKLLIDNSNYTAEKDDSAPPKTMIEVSGMNADLLIKPSLDKVIAGEVEITAQLVPQNSPAVAYSISKSKDSVSSNDQTFITIDRDPSDGWTNVFDTTTYENGTYYINAIIFSEVEGDPPAGVVQAKVEISN